MAEGTLAAGGTVIAMGESRSDLWALCVEFHERPTDLWWFTPGADLSDVATAPDHTLMRGLGKAGVTWHLHGYLDPPEGAEVLATDAEGRAILYVDEVSTTGRSVLHKATGPVPGVARFSFAIRISLCSLG